MSIKIVGGDRIDSILSRIRPTINSDLLVLQSTMVEELQHSVFRQLWQDAARYAYRRDECLMADPREVTEAKLLKQVFREVLGEFRLDPERRDAVAARLTQRYDGQLAALDERIRTTEPVVPEGAGKSLLPIPATVTITTDDKDQMLIDWDERVEAVTGDAELIGLLDAKAVEGTDE